MKLMLSSVGIALAAIMAAFAFVTVHAETAPGIRITLIQAAGADAKHERIDLENTALQPVDVTGWKLVYKSASGATSTTLVQMTADSGWHTFLDAGKRESFVSKELALVTVDGTLRSAEQFAAGINHLGGSIQLLDADGTVVDMVGWGTAAEAVRQGSVAAAMTSTTWLVRHAVTGSNGADFSLEQQSALLHPVVIGSLYDVLDVCTNLPGLQSQLPDGYQAQSGECQPVDVCPNMEGVQVNLPAGMEWNVDGSCQLIDICINIDGIQTDMPAGYEPLTGRQCVAVIPVRHLLITELLPNPSGSDTGNEFIELYNADTDAALLGEYQLMIGNKVYALPADRSIQPSGYVTLSDTDLGGNLPNTTGLEVWLLTVRGVEVASAPAYANAPDDASWVLIDGSWQYSYALTPGAENIALTYPPCQVGYERDAETHRCRSVAQVTAVAPVPCHENQYRSEETGRCRNIAAAAAVLAPCNEGQYRSEETNRCRSFASLAASVLKPCADDQFRNPVTNRCKSIASSDDVALVDCGEGRERNPITNRCRNIMTVAPTAASFPVEPVKDAAAAFAGWWALGGVGVLGLSYAGWEWRQEIAVGLKKAITFIGRR